MVIGISGIWEGGQREFWSYKRFDKDVIFLTSMVQMMPTGWQWWRQKHFTRRCPTVWINKNFLLALTYGHWQWSLCFWNDWNGLCNLKFSWRPQKVPVHPLHSHSVAFDAPEAYELLNLVASQLFQTLFVRSTNVSWKYSFKRQLLNVHFALRLTAAFCPFINPEASYTRL